MPTHRTGFGPFWRRFSQNRFQLPPRTKRTLPCATILPCGMCCMHAGLRGRGTAPSAIPCQTILRGCWKKARFGQFLPRGKGGRPLPAPLPAQHRAARLLFALAQSGKLPGLYKGDTDKRLSNSFRIFMLALHRLFDYGIVLFSYTSGGKSCPADFGGAQGICAHVRR